MKKCENSFNNEEKEKEYNDVKYIIKNGTLQDLMSIEKKYTDNVKIQSALVKRYVQDKKYKNAIFICKKYEFYGVIQSQLVTIYIEERRYEKATEICKRFPDFKELQSQLVTIYIQKKKYEEAIQICKRFFEYEEFKGQLAKIYVMQKEYDKLIELCRQFPNCASILNQLISLYIQQERWADAIVICEQFPYNDFIQYKLVTIYLKLNRLDQVIKICKRFPENEIMQNKLREITNFSNTRNDDILQEQLNALICQNKEFYKNDGVSHIMLQQNEMENSVLAEVRAKLANNTISQNDIVFLKDIESKLDDNIYKFILIAIYHRLGLTKSALQILKTVDQEYAKYKSLIFNAITSKKLSFYNLGLYDQIIDWYNINDMSNGKLNVKIK